MLRIPYPDPQHWIDKNASFFNPKNCYYVFGKMIRDVFSFFFIPDLWSRILDQDFLHPGCRTQGSKERWILGYGSATLISLFHMLILLGFTF
jgi:hypothetical protein